MADRGSRLETSSHYDTIILGAGISGLACATRLLEAAVQGDDGRRLRVLEARTRIGGRIESVNVQGWRLDTGPNWIHGEGSARRSNPLTQILPQKRCRPMRGSALFQAPQDNPIRTWCGPQDPGNHTQPMTPPPSPALHNGSSCPPSAAAMILSSVQQAIGEVQDLAMAVAASEAKHTSVLRALWNTRAFQDAFDTVPDQYHHTLAALFQGIESMEAAPLAAHTGELQRPESAPGVGLLEYAVDAYDGEDVFLQDGYAAVVEELARPLVEHGAIELDTIVTRIDWTENPIVVETSRGAFTAAEVVCTFPLGVLKDSCRDALFTPTLPTEKQEAVDSLGFGTLDKIFAIYSSPWWNHEPHKSILKGHMFHAQAAGDEEMPDSFLGFTSELDGISVGRDGDSFPGVYRLPILNLHSLTGQPILSAFVSCKSAAKVELMEDDEVAEMFHRTIAQWFGSEPPRPDCVHVTRWAQDPYSRGAYSHMITNLSEPSQRGSLQEPVMNGKGSTLWFAGEHCSREHFAMVHGALLDGWRVADTILQK